MLHGEYLARLADVLGKCEISGEDGQRVEWEKGFEGIVACFSETKRKGKRLFFIGNGGSAAIAEHMTVDFLKNGGMQTISLMGSPLITCLGNDFGYEHVYSKALSFLAGEDDLLVAISSSGNSQNIVEAILAAKARGARVLTFSGFSGANQIRRMGAWNLYVPASHYGIVESIHNLLLQQAVDTILERDGVGLA